MGPYLEIWALHIRIIWPRGQAEWSNDIGRIQIVQKRSEITPLPGQKHLLTIIITICYLCLTASCEYTTRHHPTAWLRPTPRQTRSHWSSFYEHNTPAAYHKTRWLWKWDFYFECHFQLVKSSGRIRAIQFKNEGVWVIIAVRCHYRVGDIPVNTKH